jgi:hypothetical protein
VTFQKKTAAAIQEWIWAKATEEGKPIGQAAKAVLVVLQVASTGVLIHELIK